MYLSLSASSHVVYIVRLLLLLSPIHLHHLLLVVVMVANEETQFGIGIVPTTSILGYPLSLNFSSHSLVAFTQNSISLSELSGKGDTSWNIVACRDECLG